MLNNNDNYYFNMQDGQNYLTPSRDWEVEQAPQSSTFFGVSRGVARIGLLFSGTLSITLLSRLFPPLQTFFAIALFGGVATALIYGTLARQTQQRINAGVVCLISVLGVVGGYWDGIQAFIANLAGMSIVAQVGAVATVLVLVVIVDWFFKSARDEQ